MGEGDPRAVSARLPGSILQATGIRLALSTYLCYRVMQVRALRRAAGKDLLPRRGARDPRGIGGNPRMRRLLPSKASRTSVWCEVRERYSEPLLILYRLF
jgi:hypothetical protein